MLLGLFFFANYGFRDWYYQKQSSIDAIRKRYRRYRTYRRTPMGKCDFNKVAKQFYWSHTLTWMFYCKHEVWKMVDNLQVTLCLDLNLKGHVNILYSSINSHQRCVVKKVFLKISQILQESTWWYQKHHIIIDFLLAWKATWKHKNSIY